MDNSFTSLINSATSILVLLPAKPTFDEVASGLGLYISLHETKPVTISCPSPITVNMNRLIGVNKIVTEIGNKNLTIKFNGYDASQIEKVSYDIDQGEFKLTVVPKTGFVAPQKDQLDLSFSGVSSDLVILLGGANEEEFPLLASEELSNVKVMHIGTRVLTANREVLSFASPGSSLSELVTKIIIENTMSIDPDIATNLVMGIEDGSEHFENNDVTAETFETFAFLLKNGGQRPPKIKLDAKSFPVGSIPTKPFTKQVLLQENEANDIEGTAETETDINPPADWLTQPKVYKGASQVVQPDAFSENKG